jgi:hypothetical protein
MKEEQVKRALTVWLNQFNCKVYWEKKNEYGYDVFKAKKNGKGTVEKPDLLIVRGNNSYICETKPSIHKSNIYDSLFQILKYCTCEYEYFLDGNQIYPGGACVATEHSVKGHLFDPVFESVIPYSSFGDGRKNAVVQGTHPEYEYNMTEQYTRILWRGAKKYGIDLKVGTLLSNVLNNSIPVPMFFYKQNKIVGMDLWK